MTRTRPETNLTAATLRRMADDREAAERDLAQRRTAASKVAEMAEARRILDSDVPLLYDKSMDARQRYEAAIADDHVGLAELFEVFCAARVAGAVRATTVTAAASVLDRHEPLRNETSGQAISHVGGLPYMEALRDVYLVGAPGSVIDRAVDERTTAAVNRKRDDIFAAISAVGQAAADAITH